MKKVYKASRKITDYRLLERIVLHCILWLHNTYKAFKHAWKNWHTTYYTVDTHVCESYISYVWIYVYMHCNYITFFKKRYEPVFWTQLNEFWRQAPRDWKKIHNFKLEPILIHYRILTLKYTNVINHEAIIKQYCFSLCLLRCNL